MLCDTCQRKEACIPLAFAQTDTTLRHQLSTLQQCDRQLVKSTVHKNKLRQWVGILYRRLKNLLLFCTSSVYHRFLVNSG